MNLRKEEYFPLIDDYQLSQYTVKDDLLSYEKYSNRDFTIVRRKEEEDPNNPYLRSLFISAFLRCIFALLEFPAEMEIKNEMIDKLTESNNLRDLARLVETCITGEFNIPSKFVTIIKYILLRPKRSSKNKNNFLDDEGETSQKLEGESEKDKENNLKYIANLIKKIIFKVKNKLTLDSDDSKILLLNICQCSAILCNKLNYSHPEITRLIGSNSNLSGKKKYILSKKLDEYIHFSIVDLFMSKITEYMKEEITFFLENSLKKDGDQKEKKNENENDNNAEEIEEKINAEEDNEEIEELIVLDQRIKNSSEVEVVSLLSGKGPIAGSSSVEKANKFEINEILINLISSIPLFLGEYMAKCSNERVYDIFENFTRSNVFSGINIRKSYLKEITDLMNSAKKRKLISREFKTNFMTRVNIIDLNRKKSDWFILFIFDNEMRFEASESSDEKNDLINQEKLREEDDKENDLIEDINKKLYGVKDATKSIPFDTINVIYTFEVKNRIMIKTGQGNSSEFKMLFFKKYYISDIIIEYIKLNNCNVNIIEDIPIFISDEEAAKESDEEKLVMESEEEKKIILNAIQINNENQQEKDLNEQKMNNEETAGETATPDDKLANQIDEKLKENHEHLEKLGKKKIEKKIEKLMKNPNESVTMYCNIPLKGFFDFVFNLFKSEKEIEEANAQKLNDNRVLKVNGKIFEIYNEIPENFFLIDLEKFKLETPKFSEMTFELKKCYERYDSKDISKWKNVDWAFNTLKITIDSDFYEIHCFDDFSMIKLKSCLYYYRSKEIMINNKENYDLLNLK